MKTLNRTLSLVLVLVMVLGVFGVAGAAFKDQADVKYDEAVEVMAGVGAINGYADGTFLPKGSVTREEAAKLVVYSVLGKDVADTLSVSATGFKDVAADRWSAPYISYLVGKGVINGMGDGTFAPTANVTGYQMAKMMLVAAGYGAKGEFTGNGWELAVAVAGNKTKIFDGASGVDYTKPATREEATLYAFNGMVNVPQVEYNNVFDSYLGKGTGISGGVGPTIAAEIYGVNLTQRPGNVDGVAGYYWIYKGQVISSFVDDTTVLATSTNGTALADLVNAAKAEYIGYQANTNSGTVEIDTYLNGELVDTDVALGGITSSVSTAAAKKGALVKFIDTGIDSKYDVISVTLDTVSEVTGAVTTKTTGATTTVTVPGVLGLTNVDVKNVVGYEGLAKGDYVMWHKDNSGNFYITGKCTSVTGTLMAINDAVAGKEILLIDGKQYKVSELTNADSVTTIKATLGLASTVFYLDEGGFVCKAEAAAATVNLDNTAFVVSTNTATFAKQAQLLTAEGKTIIATVAKVGTADANDTNVPALGEKFVTFVKNDDGTYNLKTITNTQKTIADYDTANTDVVFQRATPNFFFNKSGAAQNMLATASTVFVVEGATSGSFVKYVGINNVPTVKTTGTPATARGAVLCDANGYAIFAVAYGTAIDSTVLASDYVFPILPGTEIYNAAGNYFTFQAVVNGEIKTIDAVNQMDAGADGDLTPGVLTSVAMYQNGRVASTDDDAGLIANTAALGGTVTGLDDFVFNGTTVAVMDNGDVKGSFIVTDDAKFFIYDKTVSTYTIAEATAADINGLGGDSYAIQGIKKSATDSRIAMLFVTVTANTDKTTNVTAAQVGDSAYAITVGTPTGDAVTVQKSGPTQLDKGKSYTIKLNADPNARITCAVDGGTAAISNGVETIAVASDAAADIVLSFVITDLAGGTRTVNVTLDIAA